MNRRDFFKSTFAATAAGLLVPEWLLDPPKGRSMVAVADFSLTPGGVIFLSPYNGFAQWLPGHRLVEFHRGRAVIADPETIRLMRHRIELNRRSRPQQHPIESSFGGAPFMELAP